MRVRRYRRGEEAELQRLFLDTVRTVNAADYSPEQVRAWAPDDMDDERWCTRIERINPFVCLANGSIVGYADLQDSGLIDHFFVRHDWQRQGVGRRLFRAIKTEAEERGVTELKSDVSITAKPFFEAMGFSVVNEQEVALAATVLKNFRMVKQLR